MFCDSDDELDVTFMQKMIQEIECKKCDLVICGMEIGSSIDKYDLKKSDGDHFYSSEDIRYFKCIHVSC